MFDILTYGCVGPSDVEQHIGPTGFRPGDSFRTHAYGNADTQDLWTARHGGLANRCLS